MRPTAINRRLGAGLPRRGGRMAAEPASQRAGERAAVDPPLTPIQKFGEAIADRVERWMPSPFLFAIILTYVAAIAAFALERSTPAEVALAWYDGFWNRGYGTCGRNRGSDAER